MATLTNNKRSGRQNNEHWGGQRGNTRGKERQLRKRIRRMQDPRVREALDEAQRHNKSIEKATETIAERPEHAHSTITMGSPPRYTCCGALVPPPAPPTIKKRTVIQKLRLPEEGDGNGAWSLGQARQVLRQGYTLEHVVKMTGFGTKWFSDIALNDGRGLPL